jgi:uncharacterized membrane protein YedE/YeeE
MEWLLEPWPWYISGPLIGLMVPALLILTGRNFGISSSFRHIGAACAPRVNLEYLRSYNWRDQTWNLIFVFGVMLGGLVAGQLLSSEPLEFLPEYYYSWGGVLRLGLGGMLVGFGTRYANGCTSGHSIMGLAALQWPSLVATIAFFAGGFITTYLLRAIFPAL